MNLTEYLMSQRNRPAAEPEGESRYTWHPRAEQFIDLYRVDPAVVEAVVEHPTSTGDDPKAAEAGYPIRRFRRGDVEVTVGYRVPDRPAILYVHLHLPMGHAGKGTGGTPGGGRGSSAPTSVRELYGRIQAAGYTLRHGGKHTLVERPNGTVMLTLARTPSEPRSLANQWAQFVRAHAVESVSLDTED